MTDSIPVSSSAFAATSTAANRATLNISPPAPPRDGSLERLRRACLSLGKTYNSDIDRCVADSVIDRARALCAAEGKQYDPVENRCTVPLMLQTESGGNAVRRNEFLGVPTSFWLITGVGFAVLYFAFRK